MRKSSFKYILLCSVFLGIGISFYLLASATPIEQIPATAVTRGDTLSYMNYAALRRHIVSEFPNARPGRWGTFVKGVDEDIDTNSKIIALTFDACGTKYGNGYNADLIHYLHQEHIPATLFFTGLWIDANTDTFRTLAHDSLFEIENHGLKHRPCAVCGETEYGIQGTLNVGQAVDEIELNNRKIQQFTGRRPIFFRSPTAFCDETCVKVAGQLATTVISYDILSGDAVAFTPAREIAYNILKNARDGAIVILHMNHPQWYTLQALKIAIPELRKRGYKFVKLEHHRLKGKY